MKKTLSDSKFDLISIHNIIKENNIVLLQQILLQEKITIHYKDLYENSLLHIAVSYNKYEICEYLIKNNIDLNSINIWNMTPLEEAIHRKHEKISSLLRNNKAYYKNKIDSEQIIFGDRGVFFEKISLIIENLVQIFPNYCNINFFHNTYNSDYLFCCSKYETKDCSFQKYVSHFIFSKNLKMLKNNEQIDVETETSQENFIFLPYCKIYNIKQVILIPLKINNILVGYFFVWNSEKTQNVNISQLQKLFQKIILGHFFFLLQESYESYLFNIQNKMIQDFLNYSCNIIQQKNSNYDLHISILYFLENCKEFWVKIKNEHYFKELVKVVCYYNKALIPYGSLKNLYSLNNNMYHLLRKDNLIMKEDKISSYCFNKLGSINFENKDHVETFSELKMSEFDYFKIIGKELSKEQISKLNNLYENILLTDFVSFDIICSIHEILLGSKKIREQEVIGISSSLSNTFFVFADEIDESLQYVFENVKNFENIIDKIYYIFYTLTQYIHPFYDGNGRSCRIFVSFYLKKLGFNECISRMEKLISYNDFKKKFHG